jgi:CTP synthase
MSQSKYIIVSGGVVSGIGKGISAASLGLLMKMRGLTVQVIKFDPYLNVSASTLSPYQHGECWVCDDGSETDLDLGHYERIVGVEVAARNICTSGTLYSRVLTEEREGRYLGDTIQVIPHITTKIQDILLDLGKDADLVVAEIGGTVGDWESGHFYAAVREFKHKLGEENCILVHVAPILWINTIAEFKTKPLQKSMMELRSFGLEPDILLCRTDRDNRIVQDKLLAKISSLTGVAPGAVFEAPDAKSIYEVPISFYDRHIDDLIADKFKMKRTGVRIHKYRDLVEKYTYAQNLPEVTIGVVGKYASMQDAYLSLKEAIYHAGVSNNYKVNIKWIEAERLEEYTTIRGIQKFFDGVSGVIVPGGFDTRGIEGKIRAIKYVRERKIPFLGICLGMQCAVIEFARNVCGIENANSVEFQKEGQEITPVVHFVPGLEHVRKKGGTLRLGAYECVLAKDSIAADVYGKKTISERHRHRYEVNGDYAETFQRNGLMVTGTNPDTGLIEIMELDRKLHPYFVMGQFHPEFKSRLTSPHPLFDKLIYCAIHGNLDKSPTEAA